MSKETALAAAGAPTTAIEAIPVVTEAPKDEISSQKFAIFAKKEAALQKEREQLKQERDQWLKDKEEMERWKKTAGEFDETRKKDPIAALKAIGITETEIVNFLNEQKGQEPTPEEIARKIAKEEATTEAQKIRDELKAQTEAQTKERNDKLITGLKSDISSLIKDNVEKYEYCAFEGPSAERQIYEIIVENLKTNNELLSVEQATQIAEEYYEARDKQMSSLKKRQPVIVEPEKTTDVVRKEDAGKIPTSNARPKTLTNNVTATTAATAAINRRETPTEKKQRLIASLRSMA
jgi:hypothetical protein